MTGDDVTAGDEPAGAARVRPRRPPADRARAACSSAGTTCRAARSDRRRTFVVGAVENPGAPPFEYRVRRAAKKALAGARFLQLQICYRPELLERFMRAAHDTGLSERIALIPSICILRTVGGMRFVATKVPGRRRPAADRPRASSRRTDAEARVLGDRLRAGRARARPSPASPAFTSSRSARTRASQSCAHAWAFRPESKGRPMDTVLRSRSKTVTIGAEQPFCIIGERINPTGRKAFAEQLRERRPLDRHRRRDRPGRGGRRHARRQRRDPAGRRARAAEVRCCAPLRTRSTCRSASTPRVIEALEAGPVGVRGPRARQLGDRRGRAARGDPAARRAPRRRRDRARQRRDRDPGDPAEAPRVRAEDRQRRRTTTGSRPRT